MTKIQFLLKKKENSSVTAAFWNREITDEKPLGESSPPPPPAGVIQALGSLLAQKEAYQLPV